jgi:hypothetical protein
MSTRARRQGAAIAIAAALTGTGLIGVASSAEAAPAQVPAKAYDFNGDGFQDQALGSPYGDVGSVTNAGFISVVYGSATGLNITATPGTQAPHPTVINQNSPGIPGGVEAEDQFGYALTSADFDRDGYADLAVGIPGEDTGAGADAGLDTIIWGTPSGLTNVATDGTEPVEAAAGHRYGSNMTTGDLDGDGATNLVATAEGTPDFYWFDFGTALQAARTHGKAKAANVRLPRAAQRAAAAASPGVNAFYVAAGDVTGDDTDELALGWRDDDAFLPEAKAGFALYEYDSATGGLVPGTSIATPGISSIAVGDFQADGNADVAVGQVGDTPSLGGRATVYRGSATGVSPGDSYFLAQGAGIPGTAKAGDGFGWQLAVGRADGDNTDDLAVGAPLKDVGTLTDAGAAAVVYGATGGLATGRPSLVFTQDTGAIPGTAEAADQAGYHVALVDQNGDSKTELSIGVPRENGFEGYVDVLNGTTTGIVTPGSIGLGTGVLGVTGTTAQIGLRIGRL